MSHEKGIEAAQDKIYDVVSVDYGGLWRDPDAALQIIKAYLDASGMVMVPKTATPEMIAEAWASWKIRHPKPIGPGPGFVEAINAAIARAPNPFQTPEESREKK